MSIENNIFSKISKNHFNQVTGNEAITLFKNSVISVEIEVFSYCNRQCWFCPNSFIDRHSENQYMDEINYLSVLQQLQTIEYSGMISYSRYNEPLSDKIIVTRIRQAHELLPNAKLHTNTNGDYVTKEYIKKLYDAGLRSLNIQVYLGNSEYTFDDEKIKKKINIMLEKYNLEYKKTIEEYQNWYEYKLFYKDMFIKLYARNFLKNGCNRGEILDNMGIIDRINPCIMPFYYIYIDYNGNVVPCCNLRSDHPKHEHAILGNIKNNTIFDIYGNSKSSKWRECVFNWNSGKIKPCNTCNFNLIENKEYYDEWYDFNYGSQNIINKLKNYFMKIR